MFGLMTLVNAQTSPLQVYAGKYIFSPNQYVPEALVEVADSTIKVSTVMGNFTLEKKGVDTFLMNEYQALVIFKRKADNSIESVVISVAGMELVGTKEGASSIVGTKEEDLHMALWAEKLKY